MYVSAYYPVLFAPGWRNSGSLSQLSWDFVRSPKGVLPFPGLLQHGYAIFVFHVFDIYVKFDEGVYHRIYASRLGEVENFLYTETVTKMKLSTHVVFLTKQKVFLIVRYKEKVVSAVVQIFAANMCFHKMPLSKKFFLIDYAFIL